MYSRGLSTDRNMLCAIAFFCLVSLSHSAPLLCEDLVQPLGQDDRHHVVGRWALIAGSFSIPAHLNIFKRRDSASIHFSNASESSKILYTPSIYVDGQCHSRSSNVSLDGGVLTFDVQHQVNLTVTFLHTPCQDCVVMRFDNESQKLERLLLFSRRREVEQKELEEFRAQTTCLKIPPPVVMDPTKELCPEQISRVPTGPIDETTEE